MGIFLKKFILIIIINIYIILCQDSSDSSDNSDNGDNNDNSDNSDNSFDTFISSPKLIKNQLCSFNDITKINSTYIQCKCYHGFVKDDGVRKINGFEVDCSYLLKSRLLTITLSIILPLGFDYFYLGHYFIGGFILALIICIIVLNVWLLKWVLKYDKLTSVGNVDKVFEKKYIRLKFSVLIVDIIYFILYIINAILQGSGVIKDSNGYDTLYDYNLDL